jgi:hypothetical protein
MYLQIRYPNAKVVEAVVLDVRTNHLRVALSGGSDTTELTRAGDQWFSETGEPLEFDLAVFGRSEAHPTVPARTRAAG